MVKRQSEIDDKRERWLLIRPCFLFTMTLSIGAVLARFVIERNKK